MKHEQFPVNGFEFMNEPATDEQKEIIRKICKEKGIGELSDNWPEPFSKWDAYNMIEALNEQ